MPTQPTLAAGVAADHAAALFPAALAFDLVGGRVVLGHADAPAVPAEELPVGQTGGFGDDLHPPGDLRLRQPEHLHLTTHARRPDGVQGPHGGGGDGHYGALGFGVGLGADHGDAAAAVVPALGVASGQRGRLGTPESPVGQHGHQGQVRNGLAPQPAWAFPRRGREGRGWTAVSRITARTSAVRAPACRWGLARRRPQPFNASRTPRSRPGDSWPANSWALAMAEVTRRRVATAAPSPARTAR